MQKGSEKLENKAKGQNTAWGPREDFVKPLLAQNWCWRLWESEVEARHPSPHCELAFS